MVAEMSLDVTETVPRVSLPVAVAVLLRLGEGLSAFDKGPLVIAELGMAPADGVLGVRRSNRVSARSVQGVCVLSVDKCFRPLVLEVAQGGEGVVDLARTQLVVGDLAQLERP